MTGLGKLTATETKLLLRDPGNTIYALVFPPLLLVIFGLIPGFREAKPEYGGGRIIDFYLPVLTAMTVAVLAINVMPSSLASYRERGILRRMSTTPMRPLTLLVAQLVLSTVVSVLVVALLVVIGVAAFGVPWPGNPVGFVVAFLLCTTSMLTLGLLVAAVAPTGKAAGGIGTLLFFPLLFVAGLWSPGAVMPDLVRRIGEFTPLGAGSQALQQAWAGAFPQPLPLAVMAAFTVLLGLAAAKVFRWE